MTVKADIPTTKTNAAAATADPESNNMMEDIPLDDKKAAYPLTPIELEAKQSSPHQPGAADVAATKTLTKSPVAGFIALLILSTASVCILVFWYFAT